MAKRDAISKTQDAYLKWHDNLKKNVTAATTGCTAADVTMLAADNADLHAKMDGVTTADQTHADLNTSMAGSQKNVRALAQRIKKSTGYTAAIGDTLGIEGVEDSVDMPAAIWTPSSGFTNLSDYLSNLGVSNFGSTGNLGFLNGGDADAISPDGRWIVGSWDVGNGSYGDFMIDLFTPTATNSTSDALATAPDVPIIA